MDFSLLRTQVTRLSRRLRQEAQNDPDNWTHMLVLSAIDRLWIAATPSMISTTEKIRSSNLAPILKELEARGLILRTQDESDKRKTRLLLTTAGHQTLTESRKRRDQWLNQAVRASLSEEEQQLLIKAGELMERLSLYEAHNEDRTR
ncbi:MarR family winged helix-turn-helix transcriptional regulator [Silvimonas iriomotensis]|uniref:HTH marR-type domain-containing protein n=1 Tax=Silvimonas iriomotensis TaxID=449662 RepID=A0ABQ2P5R8_9NEIS|nr:MarR family transcriptional regulator [Silvimonas iriomotensis]GGP18870.1 hypothetical protein GCM10010970_07800 [Silvimonas iriomotensis]